MSEANIAMPTPDVAETQKSMLRQSLEVGAKFALAGGLLLAACSSSGDKQPTDTTVDPNRQVNVDEACGQANFAEVSNNSANYTQTAFMPKTDKLDSNDAIKGYLNSTFNVSPLGHDLDMASAAAIQSAVVEAAHDGAVADINYSYTVQFATTYAAYNAPGGLERARTDCATANSTLLQTAEYNANWAQQGEVVTEIQAMRGDDYKVNGMKLVQAPTLTTLSGAEFKLRESSKDLDGFNDVLLTADGRMFVKGVGNASISISDTGEAATFKDDQGNVIQVEVTPEGNIRTTKTDSNGNTTVSEQASGGTGGGSGAGAGNEGHNGGEKGCDGSGCGNNGCTSCGGTGGGGGGGGETPTTTGPKPTTTTTGPKPTTTTTPPPTTPPTTQPTTTTTRPKIDTTLPPDPGGY